MSEKIDLGGGHYLEPDEGETAFHRRIVKAKPILGMRAGHWLELECGHRAQAIGNLDHCDGVVLCTQCRDAHRHQAN